MLRFLIVFLILPVASWAATPAELSRLHAALQTDVLMDILSEEGLEQAEDLRDEMFPGRGGVGWTATVGQIYAPDRLASLFRGAFDMALQEDEIRPLLAFYEGNVGSRVAELEVEARRAIMSDEVEEAAKSAYSEISGSGSTRETLLQDFATLNDLVDRNVAGALNANLAFYQGLGSNGDFTMTEDEMLRDVWGQEADIRDDTIDWIFGYMTFAYSTLSDDDLQAYVDMTATDAGRDLNRALFAGFDAIFMDVSFALGAATGQFSVGDEL